MRMGVYNSELRKALVSADYSWVYQNGGIAPELERELADSASAEFDLDQMINKVVERARSGDHIVLMSNGEFDGAHAKLLRALQ